MTKMYLITACTPTNEVPAYRCETETGVKAFVNHYQPEEVPFLDDPAAFCGWKIYEFKSGFSVPHRVAFAHWDGEYNVTPFYTPEELAVRRTATARQET